MTRNETGGAGTGTERTEKQYSHNTLLPAAHTPLLLLISTLQRKNTARHDANALELYLYFVHNQ